MVSRVIRLKPKPTNTHLDNTTSIDNINQRCKAINIVLIFGSMILFFQREIFQDKSQFQMCFSSTFHKTKDRPYHNIITRNSRTIIHNNNGQTPCVCVCNFTISCKHINYSEEHRLLFLLVYICKKVYNLPVPMKPGVCNYVYLRSHSS